LRDEARRDSTNALGLVRILVDVALRGLLLEHALVLSGRGLIHIGRRHEEQLPSVDADRALFGRRGAPGAQHQR
jgi:hypothetical protein